MNNTGQPTIHKKIHQDKKAQEKLRQGIDLVADIIKQTLCPKGRNVVVQEQMYLNPRSMNDGYYIARNIEHDDPTINAGAAMMKQICAKTNEVVGDGTTTTAILAQALIKEGFKAIEGTTSESGRNPVDVKNEINSELNNALAHLKSISKPLETIEDIEHIACISGNNDKEIGKVIRDIKDKLGWPAPIITERHDKTKIEFECIKGIYLQEGYQRARAFVDNFEKKTAELKGTKDNPVRVLCLDDELIDINEVQTFMTRIKQELIEDKKAPTERNPLIDYKLLVIVKSADVESAPIALLAMNNTAKMKNQSQDGVGIGFRNVVIEAPRHVGYQPDVLDDIALATNAVVVGQRHGTKLSEVSPRAVLGTAKKVIVHKETTVIIGGGGERKTIDRHVKGLQGDLKKTRMKEQKDSLEARINMLSTGIGIVKAGGVTNVEAKERELRLEDAILATKAAIEEGIVVGGGQVFESIAREVKSNIFKEACAEIPLQILKNSGRDGADTAINLGFNALTGEYEDLIKAGVIDATKVIRVALENAVSFSSLLLTTSASIIIYEKN